MRNSVLPLSSKGSPSKWPSLKVIWRVEPSGLANRSCTANSSVLAPSAFALAALT